MENNPHTCPVSSRDFSKATLRALAKRGVSLIGCTNLPATIGVGHRTLARGYQVSDNGTGRILTHAQVLEAACR